jgi:hypothetical protein
MTWRHYATKCGRVRNPMPTAEGSRSVCMEGPPIDQTFVPSHRPIRFDTRCAGPREQDLQVVP